MNEFLPRAEIVAPVASAAVERTTPKVACKDQSSVEDNDDDDDDTRAVQHQQEQQQQYQQRRTTTAHEDGNSDNDNQGNHNSSRLDHDIWMDDDDSSSLPPPPPSTTTSTTTTTSTPTRRSSVLILRNFVLQSVLVATVPATALACLALATAELGSSLGATQSGVLYVSYTTSSIAGAATYVVKRWGARNALTVGMALFALYVACFVVALVVQDDDDDGDGDNNDDDADMHQKDAWALTGAAVGGMGAGILWTAQGVYLAHAARDYAMALQQQQDESSRQHPRGRGVPVTTTTTTSQGHNHAYAQATTSTFSQEEKAQDETQQVVSSSWPIQNEPNTETMDQSTNYLAGLFAFCFLSLETTLDVLSTVLVRMGFPWRFVFAIYATATAVATGSMPLLVHNYPSDTTKGNPDDGPCHKAMAALRILRDDARIKYMWGMNAAFGLAGAFLTSFVNGQVVPVVLNRNDVGVLVALHGATAALCSLGFAQLTSNRCRRCRIGKHVILVVGALGYMAVALPFCIQPNLSAWTWRGVAGVYMAQGLGRATFEGTFRALFCDYFAYETEGAFANIILQNGLASAVGFVLSIRLPCTASTPSQHCIEYQDGSHHDILKFGMIVVGTSVLAIIGLFRASCLTESGTARSVPRPPARHYHAVVAQQSTVSDHADGEFSTTGISLSPLT